MRYTAVAANRASTVLTSRTSGTRRFMLHPGHPGLERLGSVNAGSAYAQLVGWVEGTVSVFVTLAFWGKVERYTTVPVSSNVLVQAVSPCSKAASAESAGITIRSKLCCLRTFSQPLVP